MKDAIDFKNTDIAKLFRRFLIPTVLGMVFSAVFIITDGIFVGKGIGSDALAAVNIVAPLYMLSTGLGLMFGMGGSVVAAIHLSRGKTKVANINITQAIVVPAFFMILTTGLTISFRKEIVLLLGTPYELVEMAEAYLHYFAYFFTFNMLFNVLMFVVRVDGSPNIAMTCNIIAALINIGLDYLFIFVFGWGLEGAAVATGIGITVSVFLLGSYLLFYSRTIHLVKIKFSRNSLLLTLRNTGYMAKIGFPALLGDLAISCMMLTGNYVFIRYIGTDGVAAFSIVCYFFPIIFMVYNGIIQSAQPIISFNYGCGDTVRVKKAAVLALKTAIACGIVFFTTNGIFNHQIIALFISPATPTYAVAAAGIPYFAAGYIFFGINIVAIGYFQSIEQAKLATFLTVLRGMLLMAACFLLLPPLLGTKGIWLAVPLAEFLEMILIGFLFFRRRKATFTPGKITVKTK